jgi:hypothetical protein
MYEVIEPTDIGAMSRADPAPTIHYVPAENLEHIDGRVFSLDSVPEDVFDFFASRNHDGNCGK